MWSRLGLVRSPLSFHALTFLILSHALELDDLLLGQSGGAIAGPLMGRYLHSGRSLIGLCSQGKLLRELRPRIGAFERWVQRYRANRLLGRVSVIICPPIYGYGRERWRRCT